MMYLADTTFIIDLVKGDEGAKTLALEIDDKNIPVSISTITVQEYLRGVYYLFSEDQELLHEKLLQAESDLAKLEIIDFSYSVAKIAAELDAGLTRSGNQLALADIQIAATAISLNYPLITRNLAHFGRIPDLQTISY